MLTTVSIFAQLYQLPQQVQTPLPQTTCTNLYLDEVANDCSASRQVRFYYHKNEMLLVKGQRNLFYWLTDIKLNG